LFGLIPSKAQVIGSLIEGKFFYRFRVCTKRGVEGILMEMGGMEARVKVQKLIKIYSTINKGWRWPWKTVGGWRRWGAIMTNDNGACNTLSLNNVICI
jgi:hypothetical protein